MKIIPVNIARDLASNLYLLTLDVTTVANFSFGVAEKDERKSQQISLDLLWRCLKSNLIKIFPEDFFSKNKKWTDLESLMVDLAQQDQDSIPWLIPQVICTSKGDSLYKEFFSGKCLFYISNDIKDNKYSIYNDDIIMKFSFRICEIFEECGVPWSDEPLFRLRY